MMMSESCSSLNELRAAILCLLYVKCSSVAAAARGELAVRQAINIVLT